MHNAYVMSQNGQTNFKNLAALCIKGLSLMRSKGHKKGLKQANQDQNVYKQFPKKLTLLLLSLIFASYPEIFVSLNYTVT